MDDRQIGLITLLDFSNAFNCVDHDILLAILRSLNISQSAHEWFSSYLHGRSQCIRADDVYSEWCDVSAGVPQGGVLSPLLFSVFINTLVSVILHSNYHLYADDLQIYKFFKDEDILVGIDKISQDLDAIKLWTDRYGLKVNPAKTQVMFVGRKAALARLNIDSLPQITFDGVVLKYQGEVKNLGIRVSQDLSWASQVAEMSQKVFASLHSLKRLQNFLPISTKITLVNSLLLPIIDYADVSYPDLTEELLNKLDRLLNVCIRYIFGLRKYDHISSSRLKLKWLNIRLRRNLHLLTYLYGILNNPNSPQYLKERFQFLSDSGRSHRSPYIATLRTPEHNTALYSDSFTVTAIRLWNSLPPAIRAAPSIFCFKSQVYTHFLNIQNQTIT